jgi:hypothetical protein
VQDPHSCFVLALERFFAVFAAQKRSGVGKQMQVGLDVSAPDARRITNIHIGDALKTFAVKQLERAIKFLSQPGKSRHQGIHEGRKCIRRTRAALALGMHAFKREKCGERAVRLDHDLGQLCRGLSPLRDAQALIEALARLRDAPEVLTGGSYGAQLTNVLPDAVSAAMARREQMLKRALQRNPGFALRRARLRRAIAALARLPWHDALWPDIHIGLSRSMRRFKKARRQAHRQTNNDALWHVLRRRLRRLRQQIGMLAEIQPKTVETGSDGKLATFSIDSFAKANALEQEAVRLGESQDDALLLKHCGKRSPFSPSHRKLFRAVAKARLRQVRKG